ncbi:MAG: CpaE family protein [Chloroflexota bacterium]
MNAGPLPILLAAPGLPGEPELVARLGHPGSPICVLRRCVDAVDLIGASASGTARAAVISSTLPRLSRETVARLRQAGIAVHGIATDAEGEPGRLVALGVDVVRVPHGDPEATVGILVRALLGAEHSEQRSASDPAPIRVVPPDGGAGTAVRGKLVVVWGPHGAPGRTTTAITLADEAARAGVPALLVDADTYGGAIAARLGVIDDVSGLVVACRQADIAALDSSALAGSARSLSRRFRVITGIARAERWSELRPAALGRLWEACRETSGITVADVGFALDLSEGPSVESRAPRRDGATMSALAAADEVVAVGTADPVGIDRLLQGLADVADAAPQARVRVVVTRVRAASLGRRPEKQIREALEHHAGVTGAVLVPDDPDAFDACLREGRTLAECAPRSAARAPLRGLAATVAATRVPRLEPCPTPVPVTSPRPTRASPDSSWIGAAS